jgi:ubiquinone/menaquinone biosynthesis C-methylase UbiE
MGAQMTPPSESQSVPISPAELRDRLLLYRAENWKGIQTPEMQVAIVDAMLHADASIVLNQVARFAAVPPGAMILDIGSGTGGFAVGCRQLGYRAFGVEPDRIGAGARVTSIEIAARRLSSNVFASAIGEALPFGDQVFDLVTLNQVVEHVPDQLAVLREAVRVLRPGGVLYVACPNYLRFYEPHYKVFWLPLMHKSLGRLYLRLRGRNPVMLRDLYYTTNRRLRKWLEALGDGFEVLDCNQVRFIDKCAGKGEFLSRRARILKNVIAFPAIGSVLRWGILRWIRLREGGCEMLLVRKDRVK